MLIDARGLGCPKPVLMVEEALNSMNEGTVEVLVDNEASVGNLKRFAQNNGMHVESEARGDYWAVRITKGYACDITPESAITSQEKELPEQEKKGILMIIGTDTLGKEEGIGKILMKGFLETMKVTREVPDTLFFLNAGVRLTTINEETAPIIKDMEAMGVEIFSCGTCLKHYGLEKSLKVGYRGTTNHIVEGIKDFAKVVWI